MAAPEPDTPARSRAPVALLAALLVAVTFAAYHRVGGVPFVFDDAAAVLENPTIRHLWPLRDVLSPPQNVTGAVGRPLVNLSLALNHALGGTAPGGYHWFNLGVHVAGALALFGIVRRTLRRPPLAARFAAGATLLGWGAALLWALHPLQTESVVCVIQRSELIVGLFYLLTLYAFIRSVESPSPLRWQIAAWLACALGMASKELMVSAPLMVLLYDRTFVTGGFGAAWRARKKFYVALAATWLLLAWVALGSGQRGGTSGFGLGVSAWEYLLTQCRAIVLYLKLSLWPDPLVLDYGVETISSAAQVAGRGIFLLALAAGTIVALWRRPVLGFVGFWSFAILAPSSSFVPLTTQTMAEHRMYLPLAAVIVLIVAAAQAAARTRAPAIIVVLALGCAALTVRRVGDYRDEKTLWRDTVAKWPSNARALNNLASCQVKDGETAAAIANFEAALKLRPDYADAHSNLGVLLLQQGRTAEAVAHHRTAVQIQPESARARYNFAIGLLAAGDPVGAVAGFKEALRLGGGDNEGNVRHNLALALEKTGQPAEAAAQYEQVLRLDPAHVEANNNLAMLLAARGEMEPAVQYLTRAVQAEPKSADIEFNFGLILARRGRLAEAVPHYRRAIELRPDFALARIALGMALADLGQAPAAATEFETVLARDPANAEAHLQLATVRAQQNRMPDAIAHYEQALKARPDFFEVHNDLAVALRRAGRPAEALPHFRAALKLRPDSPEVHYNFALALKDTGQTADARLHEAEARRRRPDLPALNW